MEIPQHDVRVHINLDEFNTVFVDGVQMEAKPEVVYLMMLQHLPGSEENELPTAKVVQRIALSWPHAARLAYMINEAIKDQRDKIKTHYDQYVFQPEQMGKK